MPAMNRTTQSSAQRVPISVRLAIAGAAALALPASPASAADFTGPSTTTAPYVKSVAPGVDITSLLTAGDSVGGYRMAGIPDGLGIAPSWGGFTLSMNHELRSTTGVVRRHGAKGAFVSQWQIGRDKRVRAGSDLIDPGIRFWDYPSRAYSAVPSTGGANPRAAGDTFLAQVAEFNRFCSASLAPASVLRGWRGRGLWESGIFFANEEAGDEGRTFGVLDDGRTQQLPRLGLASWENHVVADTGSDDTVVVGGEDGGDAQLWVYRGRKQRTGDPFRRAGLSTGTNAVLDLERSDVTNDAGFRAAIGKGAPTRFELNTVDWDASGARQNADAKARGLSLNRIEDAAFDPRDENVLWFVTTEGGNTTPAPGSTAPRDGGGVWKVTFDDVADPESGGTIELVLDGSEAPYLNKPDNITVDRWGNLLIQEDPGNNPHVARIVAVDTRNPARRAVLAQFDPAQFSGAAAITADEESSGIIEVPGAPGSYAFDAQVHKGLADPELVEMGQLLTMQVKSWNQVYASGQPAS